MAAYYNEIDAYAAGWLRNLIESGLIPAGDVDERDIREVRPDELRRYTQCHFFAGIGGWALALRLAGWADDRPVWTGSCPCQPFSAAGKKARQSDERHLWPHWNRLIGECAPAVIFGEQVDDAVTSGWLDDVFNDLEAKNYACAASVLPACSVGKPHRRDRIFFVADAHFHGDRQPQRGLSGTPQAMAAFTGQEDGAARQSGGAGRSGGLLADTAGERIRRASGNVREAHGRPDGKLSLEPDGAGARHVADAARGEMGGAGQPRERIDVADSAGARSYASAQPGICRDEKGSGSRHGESQRCGGGIVEDAEGLRRRERRAEPARQQGRLGFARASTSGIALDYAFGARLERYAGHEQECRGQAEDGSAAEADTTAITWLACPDGKIRPVKPGVRLLAHGIPARVGRLRAYGNAIVPEVAAEFIAAYREAVAWHS